MNARLMTMLAAMAAMAAVAAGCGGGSSSSREEAQPSAAVTTSSLGRSAYVKKLDAACLQAKKGMLAELSAFQSNGSGPHSGPRYAANAVKEVLLPVAEAQTAAIGETGAPKADQAKIEAIVAGREQAVEEAKELEEVKAVTDYQDLFAQSSKELEQYGVTKCNLNL